jgi:hypothetical protein
VRGARRAVVALALAAALAAGACSGSDDAAPRTKTTAERSTSSSTTLPTFTGDPASPFCSLLRGVDTRSVLQGDPNDPAAVQAGFRRLVGVLHDALALSPPEIEADLALVSQGIEQLDATLAAVGYDYDALAASGQAPKLSQAVNDPAFTAAGARLGAYRTQVCQL